MLPPRVLHPQVLAAMLYWKKGDFVYLFCFCIDLERHLQGTAATEAGEKTRCRSCAKRLTTCIFCLLPMYVFLVYERCLFQPTVTRVCSVILV
jgi:hypothetical protein